MNLSRHFRHAVMLMFGLACGTQPAHGYNLFGPYPWGNEGLTYYNKWGDIFTPGSSGGTITWSIMPDGTTIDPAFSDPNITGVSTLNALMTSLGYDQALAAIERSLAQWSSAANIYFVRVPDSGVPFHSPGATPPDTGQIRLGAFAINAGIGAVGYAPPPNGGTLEGDVLLNSNSTFFFDDGAEGELIDVFNDFEGLILHELGHAMGLAHSDAQSVMSVNYDIFKYVNRILDPDDVAAVQFLYGPALRADFNHDNVVDDDDLAIWKTGFGTTLAVDPMTGDADGNGAIDGADLLVWQRESSTGAGTSTAVATVPEGSALTLALVAAGVAAYCRGRR
ncbi:matrixin family metalloprotease [Lacipirellula limnantheis]|uniref:Matrixin n=1 Tax=Lacipirellula limnantheis TaxID=2528024 RepID=A0A517TUW2_9BACT|nr:matrixin family metalloprotease [Lacipirellula limnantheis]QDT72148.1 Matrixin [Lacipirellula limnantheis]